DAANGSLIQEFYLWMKDNQSSEAHQKNNLKAVMNFTRWLRANQPGTTLLDVNKKELVLKFLATKEKTSDEDLEGKWITTWNDYLNRIKLFYRWVHNYRNASDEMKRLPVSEWKTPGFVQLKPKKSWRASPYSATEVWELEELLTVVKYEPQQRNKAAIMLMWDLNARNHEVTNLRIKNIRLKENYGEGEIPYGKTGSGPILLTASFPYVRDWLNLHPLKDVPDARLICDLNTGKPLTPDRIWFIMTQLRERIKAVVKAGLVKDESERQKLEYLLKTKKWNPYCLRHSSIEHDSGYLPEFALRKKVRWTLNSKQPARYIKNKWTLEIKRQILGNSGIEMTSAESKHVSVHRPCPRCSLANAPENRTCSRCGYPLSQEALEEIKAREKEEMKKALVELLEEHPELMVEKFGRMHGYGFIVSGQGNLTAMNGEAPIAFAALPADATAAMARSSPRRVYDRPSSLFTIEGSRQENH
ncbi:MAG TPA: site-specific integrase, partial [Nitrososphaera sp.]|nr:site-specific integrase [Nitrososphaera sp.]